MNLLTKLKIKYKIFLCKERSKKVIDLVYRYNKLEKDFYKESEDASYVKDYILEELKEKLILLEIKIHKIDIKLRHSLFFEFNDERYRFTYNSMSGEHWLLKSGEDKQSYYYYSDIKDAINKKHYKVIY